MRMLLHGGPHVRFADRARWADLCMGLPQRWMHKAVASLVSTCFYLYAFVDSLFLFMFRILLSLLAVFSYIYLNTSDVNWI